MGSERRAPKPPSPVARVLVLASLGALALHGAVGAVLVARGTLAKVREAALMAGKEEPEVRRLVLGPRLAAAADRARDAVGRTEGLAVVDGAGGDGSAYWLRYDLSPRRLLLASDAMPVPPEAAPKGLTPWTLVVDPSPREPRLVDSAAASGGRSSFSPGRLDDSIPASIDEPSEGGRVAGDLQVRGWCQELGSRPCEGFRFLVDGMLVDPLVVERHRRPDVERAVPGIGPADSAGYKAVLKLPPGTAGPRTVSVYFVTRDGRYRLLGPRQFEWEPK